MITRRKHRHSAILASVHETMTDLHEAGFVDATAPADETEAAPEAPKTEPTPEEETPARK